MGKWKNECINLNIFAVYLKREYIYIYINNITEHENSLTLFVYFVNEKSSILFEND